MFFLSLIPTALFLSTSCSVVSNYEQSIYVQQVIDGDTFSDQYQQKYRVLGIDTPEVYDANNNFQPTTGIKYFYGKLASDAAYQLLKNQWVEIEYLKDDAYQRKVAKVKLANNIDYASYMVSKGYAKVRYISTNKNSPFYYYDANYVDHLYRMENEAKEQKLGFWSESASNINQIFN